MSKFNVGDRVRVKNPDWERHFDCGNDIGALTNEDIGVVKGEASYWNGLIEVSFLDGFVCLDFSEDELELVASSDPKTAFLTELKELLEKYDVEIIAHIGEDNTTNKDKPLIYIQIRGEVLNYERGCDYCDITANNIMDYDKE